MRRLRVQPIVDVDPQKLVGDFVGTKPRAKRAPNKTRARDELQTMLMTSNFSSAKPTHLVALYEWCHEQVYGARPSELDTGNSWKLATFAAARLTRDEFAEDIQQAIEFVRWTWQRERVREHMRRTGKNDSVGRIGWRLQFVTRHLVTDYRIDLARTR